MPSVFYLRYVGSYHYLVTYLRRGFQTFIPPMINIGHNVFGGSGIASEFVGNHHPWLTTVSLDQVRVKALGCSLVAPFLHQSIEHVPMLIHGKLEIESLTDDLDHSLIKKPRVAWSWPVPPNNIGEQWTKPLLPFMDGLATDVDATISEDILDIARLRLN